MQRTKFEIPFGHAFDKRGVSSSKSAVRVGGATITFASHEANAPTLTPDIPAMIAAATMALIATKTPQRRSALR